MFLWFSKSRAHFKFVYQRWPTSGWWLNFALTLSTASIIAVHFITKYHRHCGRTENLRPHREVLRLTSWINSKSCFVKYRYKRLVFLYVFSVFSYINLKCTSPTILHKEIALNILAYNVMLLSFKFLLILLSDINCQPLNKWYLNKCVNISTLDCLSTKLNFEVQKQVLSWQ